MNNIHQLLQNMLKDIHQLLQMLTFEAKVETTFLVAVTVQIEGFFSPRILFQSKHFPAAYTPSKDDKLFIRDVFIKKESVQDMQFHLEKIQEKMAEMK